MFRERDRMVDREGRRRAANLITAFIAGEITNDDIENGWPEKSTDKALEAIYLRLWSFYSDLRTHKILSTVASQQTESFRRIIDFLESDLEYEWRDLGLHSWFNPWLLALKIGALSHERKEKLRFGDYEVWPFFRRIDSVKFAESGR